MQIVRKRAEEANWQQVKQMVNDDQLQVGDEVLDFMGNIPMIYQVAEITPEEVHFISKGVHPERVAWNENGKTEGGFKVSDLRKHLEENLWPLLPDELKEVISEREVLQIVDGEEERYTLKLWLPTEYEVFGEAWDNDDAEGQQFSLFKDPANRVKCVAGEEGNRATWWLLSVYGGDSTGACSVSNNGYANNYNCTSDFRVPLCFSIKR